MLPAKFRLKDRKSFNDVFRLGKTVSNELAIMKYKKVGAEDLKIGFSAGLRFSKKSSERNKAKRWMREAVREKLAAMKPGYQVIFIISSKFPPGRINFSIVRDKVENLLKRAKILS